MPAMWMVGQLAIQELEQRVNACAAKWEPIIEDSIGVQYGSYGDHATHCRNCAPIIAIIHENARLRAENARLLEALKQVWEDIPNTSSVPQWMSDDWRHAAGTTRRHVSEALAATPADSAKWLEDKLAAARVKTREVCNWEIHERELAAALKRADAEDGCQVSVGGLVTDLENAAKNPRGNAP